MPNPIKGFQTKDGVRKYDYNELENLPENDPDDLALEVEEVKENIETKKANVIKNTATGDIASFTDGADDYPVKDLVAHIEPVQDLHGYANPWPGGGGKNLFNSATFTTTTKCGVTCTNNGDGTYTLNGTATQAAYFDIFNAQFSESDGGAALPSAKYRLTGTPSSGSGSTYTMYTRPSYSNDLGNGVTFTNSVVGGSIFIAVGYTCNNLVFKPMLRLASNGDDTFEPYSNICPITGWTGANVTRTGKNLLPNKTCHWPENKLIIGDDRIREGIFLKQGTYTVSARRSKGKIFCKTSSGSNITLTPNVSTLSGTLTVAKDDYYRFWIYDSSGVTASDVEWFQLELGSTATEYEPYQGDTYAVTFPTEAGTVYGGTLDVTTGVLTVDTVSKTISSGRVGGVITQLTNTTRFLLLNVLVPGWHSRFIKCDRLNRNYYGEDAVGFSHGDDSANVFIKLDKSLGLTTAELIYEWLSNNPLQFVYELATPTTYQLTPTEVKTLLGANNIFADTGSVDVEYCADTKKYIDNAIAAAVASLS